MRSHAVRRRLNIVDALGAVIAAAFLAFGLQPAVFCQAATSIPGNSSAGARENRSTPGTNAQTPMITVPSDFADLRLAPGFLLNVEVYDEPDFSGLIRVDSEGNINLPFLKTMHVAGDTVEQARNKIERMFKDQAILKNPQVSVSVEQFASTSATVLGEVQNPGKVELLAPHNLIDVLGLAGGETSLAGNEIDIKHASRSAGISTTVCHYSKGSNEDGIRNVKVYPGDTVIVKRAGIVYVLGAVNRPGGYAMQEDGELNVAQAISMAQGLAMQAKTGGLRVVRQSAGGELVDMPVSYKRMMDGKQAPMTLVAGDIVYVPVSKIKAVFSGGSALIGETTAATIYTVH
ncbi:MAG: polysaccharide biosynthesis/export family protein [Terracidiphilus sp.]